MNDAEHKQQQAAQRKERRELWTAFYDREKLFLDWLNNHAIILLDIKASTPMFDITGEHAEFGYEYYQLASGKVQNRPPRFIRKVISFNNMEMYNECLKQHGEVKQKFIDAVTFMNEKTFSFPQRFPLFHSDVIHITHTTDDAYKARILPLEGRFEVYFGPYDAEYMQEIVTCFKSAGLETINVEVDNHQLSMVVSIDILDMRNYFKCSDDTVIHCRIHTGKQYTCRIMKAVNGLELPPVRSKFGLIVLDPKSRGCDFYLSQPRKKRTDTLENRGEEVRLPIHFGYRLFLTK